MTRPTLVACLVIAMALAGCSDGGESSTTSKCDHETHYIDEAGECLLHVEPSIVMTGLPDTIEQFYAYEFNWSLDPGTRGMDGVVHSMDSRIMASQDSAPATNATGPDEWGIEVARQQHQNLPQNFTASFVGDEIGTYYLKGYMLINGQNVWTDLGSVDVTMVQATGTTVTIEITDSPQPALSSSSVGMKVGDAVKVVNDHAFIDYRVEFSCSNGVTIQALSAAAGGESSSAVVLVPTNCDFVAKTPASQYDVTQGELSGRLNVNKP